MKQDCIGLTTRPHEREQTVVNVVGRLISERQTGQDPVARHRVEIAPYRVRDVVKSRG